MTTLRLARAAVPRKLRVPAAIHILGRRVKAWTFLFLVMMVVLALFFILVGAQIEKVTKLIGVQVLIGLIFLEIRPAGRSMRTILRIRRRQLLRTKRIRLDSIWMTLSSEATLLPSGRRPRWQSASNSTIPLQHEGGPHS